MSERQATALAAGELEQAGLDSPLRELLAMARKLTLEPARMTEAEIQLLREVGWSNEQIAEAVYVVAMFALFNRVADAFGLVDPVYQSMNDEESVRPATRYGGDSG